LLLTACSFHVGPLGTSTQGEHGTAQFAYDACLFGCKIDSAMMVGTSEIIRVTAIAIPPVEVRSSDDGAFSVSAATRHCCTANAGACHDLPANEACAVDETTSSLSISVVANGAGNAELVLDAGQKAGVFDSIALDVAEPASLAVSCGTGVGDVSLASTSSCSLGWTARAANGDVLMASTGVTMTTSDPKVADFRATILSANESSITALQGMLGSTLDAHSAGETTIQANAGGASSKLAVHVTP